MKLPVYQGLHIYERLRPTSEGYIQGSERGQLFRDFETQGRCRMCHGFDSAFSLQGAL